MNGKVNKIVVFDLDETLGYFVEFGIFWQVLAKYFKYIKIDYTLSQEDFNLLFNLYPDFQRPKIMKILNYLKNQKKINCCNKIMIYTNNQGPTTWANYIKNYYETKLNYPLFDQIISAFKINGKKIEIYRTSHSKNYKDLVRCTKIPETCQICFLDDTFYPEMSVPNVYYINVKPYVHHIPFKEMIHTFINSRIFRDKINDEFKLFMENCMNKFIYRYDKDEHEINENRLISNKILEHLHIFFNTSPPSTRKHKKDVKNKTRKNK
jgi:hypothetical protein